ncbi:hypothetical protein SAY87_023874 [Trapa incisa]|uniref:Stress response NST1-like protein n=1 Tax=Trapa incisa TaxID=236973 RepID=A0AAN7L474_9MYRT|nr:hypothetical protein SAY87_023874 [Trapa incisa]
MCILCVIQKWSRRVATMLPWLVFPLIFLWVLSQFFPPAFRFEITSPRLACVFVLLVTLFWYEILMPKLSAWRARRNAWLREKKRNEAIELQKLRKTATRKCRNCLNPYKEQNPGGGKFMCSYCGHISKRPVLELPVQPGMGISSSGIFKDLVGKGGKLLNGRVWTDNGWMCNQNWRTCGNWTAGSSASKPVNWRKNGNGLFGGDESCLAENSYTGIIAFVCNLLTSFFLSVRWLWRKIFCSNSLREDAAFHAEHRGILNNRGENLGNSQETRSEKARRKAEERRQARLERELREEEERKQREEVAKLVEERRKLRDENSGTEKVSEKPVSPVKDKHSKKEAEKRRHERRKDKDRGSSKSNSDVEELDRRVSKETDRKHDSEKKSEFDSQEIQKSVIDSMKGQNIGVLRGPKSVSGNSFNRYNAGARYLDRMRGTLISSSRALSGSNFFGKTANSSTSISRESRSDHDVNRAPVSAPKRDVCTPVPMAGKSAISGAALEPQPIPAPKKSWQQLFTRATPVHPSSNSNVISKPNTKMPTEQSSALPDQAMSSQSFDRPISFGLPSPYDVCSLQNTMPSSSLGFSLAIEPIFPHLRERPHENMPEEPELFEDPCYVPDPVSLLGPVSESLNNFQLDVGSTFVSGIGLEKSRIQKVSSVASEISRPSPIESPLSRLRVVDDKHGDISCRPTTPMSQEQQSYPVEDSSGNDEKIWQMWGPSPLGQECLGFIGGSAWNLNPEPHRSSKEEFVHPPMRSMTCFTQEDPILPNIYSPQKDFLGSGLDIGTYKTAAISNDKDPLLQKAFFSPLSENGKHLPFKHQESSTPNDIFFGTSARPHTYTHPLEQTPANCWTKKDWTVPDSEEVTGNHSISILQTRQLFPPQMYSHFGNETGK